MNTIKLISFSMICRILLMLFTFLGCGYSAEPNQTPSFLKPFQIKVGSEPIAFRKGYTFPTFVDLNSDGLKDLIVGVYDGPGLIFYFENIGTDISPAFAKGKKLQAGESALSVPGIGP